MTTDQTQTEPETPDAPGLTGTVSVRAADTRAIGYLRREGPADPDGPTPPPPEPGTVLGGYVLQQLLGHGVSCHVFRAWDEARSRPVAVKVLNWATAYDRPAALAQLRAEAAALARVKHPQVVRFIDFGFDPRWPYLVTEFFEGQTLGELVRDGGPLPPAWAVYVASQVADALGAVWSAGLVHRDVKPDNVLVGPNGACKLIDFGLAMSPAVRASRQTAEPELAGTAAYIAPEQAIDAGVVDHRADIYSLGVTLYEALTGRLPFDGRNRMQVIFQHINSAPPPPTQRAPGIPPLVSDLCLWMLAKDPADRPRNHDELRRAFDTVTGTAR